jgi:hexosaminidase
MTPTLGGLPMKFKFLVLTLLIFVSCSSSFSASRTALWGEGISLIPYPQEVKLGGEGFLFGSGVSVVLDGSASSSDRFAAEDLAGRLKADWGINAQRNGHDTNRVILLTRQAADKTLRQQGYELLVEKRRITVRAVDEPGLFYGTRTLLQLIQKSDLGPLVKGMRIVDWPDIPYRAVHYDTQHHQDKMEYVRGFVRDLADYKINMLIWEWEDKFSYQSHAEIGAPGAFTRAEIQELTRFARQYHVQLTPLVQGLGHVSYILKWPQYASLREIPASNLEFCPLREGSYKLLFDLWDEAIEATLGSEFLHIGSDETYELGQGTECGCKARLDELGRSSFYMEFIQRCAQHVNAKGRRYIAWTPPYQPNQRIRPPKGGPAMAEALDLKNVEVAREDGYPCWVYVPNPGIEHLFLPYFYRENENHLETTLEEAYQTLTTAAPSGLFEGMVCTSWDDSGLHNQCWMMRFINAAEYSWSGKKPELEEFIDKYFANYYGPGARNLRELFLLLGKGAYYYMDTFERKVWHWGAIGKTHLPDLPRGDAIEYDPYWNGEYKKIVDRSQEQLAAMRRAQDICRQNLKSGVRHSYDFEVYTSIAALISHTARTYLALSEVEKAIAVAHEQHFKSHPTAYSWLEKAVRILEENLHDRETVFNCLVSTWEKTRFPKGLSEPGRQYFHCQDRARHFANRRPDMTYLIYDEQKLKVEDYVESLRRYLDWYKGAYF